MVTSYPRSQATCGAMAIYPCGAAHRPNPMFSSLSFLKMSADRNQATEDRSAAVAGSVGRDPEPRGSEEAAEFAPRLRKGEPVDVQKMFCLREESDRVSGRGVQPKAKTSQGSVQQFRERREAERTHSNRSDEEARVYAQLLW